MSRLQRLSSLVLPCMVIIGYIFGDTVFTLLMSLQLDSMVTMKRLFWHLSSFDWLLKIVCPLLVSFVWLFRHYNIAITMKNSLYIALITCALVLLLNGLSIGLTQYLYETLSAESFMRFSLKISPVLNILLMPIGLPLLFWMLLSIQLPLARQKNHEVLSHGIILLLLLCVVGAILYWVLILSVGSSVFTLNHIKFVLCIIMGCFIYGRVRYAFWDNVERITIVRVLIMVIALVLSSIASVVLAKYIVKNYGAKEMASLIIFIMIAGLAMITSTQIIMRKLFYEITPMK